MLVLKILIAIIIVVVLALIIKSINNYTIKKYNYDFFNYGNLILISIAYFGAFFGYKWYINALHTHADTLNGILLIGISGIIILSVFIYNIRKTSFLFGFFIGIIQLLLYIPLSMFVALIILLFIAWASETKPVYVWNNN